MLAVTKQFLNRPQVGSSLEQMGRKRVAQRVRMGAGEARFCSRRSPRPGTQPAAHVRGAKAPPRLGEEQRSRLVSEQDRAAR